MGTRIDVGVRVYKFIGSVLKSYSIIRKPKELLTLYLFIGRNLFLFLEFATGNFSIKFIFTSPKYCVNNHIEENFRIYFPAPPNNRNVFFASLNA